MVNAAIKARSGLQLDVPIEVIAPALVEVIGREALAVVLQLPAGRADRLTLEMHLRLAGRAAALPEVARSAGSGDILPGGAAALGARDDMVERQLAARSAIDAAEAVAQEQVEPGESGILVGLDELPERNDRRQLQRPARAVHLAV